MNFLPNFFAVTSYPRLSMAAKLILFSGVLSLFTFTSAAELGAREFPETATKGLTKFGERSISCGQRFMGSSRRVRAAETAPIVGGQDAQPGEFPFIVSMIHGAFNTHFCGGSLVGPRHVLTAAHCVQRKRENLRVRVREYNINREGQPPAIEMKVQSYVQHPEWNPLTLKNDLAMLTLESDFSPDSYTQAICLPCCTAAKLGGTDYMVGKQLTVAGWGATEEGGRMSSVLQKLNVPVVSNEHCRDKLFPQFIITETQICAGYPEGGKDSCQGDSGGPLFTESDGLMTLEGIVSAGIGCARVGMPGVYTRVSEYVPWIASVMAANVPPRGSVIMGGSQGDSRPPSPLASGLSSLFPASVFGQSADHGGNPLLNAFSAFFTNARSMEDNSD